MPVQITNFFDGENEKKILKVVNGRNENKKVNSQQFRKFEKKTSNGNVFFSSTRNFTQQKFETRNTKKRNGEGGLRVLVTLALLASY